VTGALSRRVPGLLALAGAGLIAGLASGHPELAVLAAPILVYLGAGLVASCEPRLTAELLLERKRVLEGERVTGVVRLTNHGTAGATLELDLAHPPDVELEPSGPILVGTGAGATRELELHLRAVRWGAHQLGPLAVRARDPLGVRVWSGRLGAPLALRVFPREQRLRQLVAPQETQPFLGSHVARRRGEGIEFAEIRPFAIGDRVRRVNWRASARRGALYVTDRHPEHASDVVLLLDTFAEARGAGSGTLDAAVRATASLARAHLARRDRVALVDFGGTLHWLEPAFGTVQLYRILDALLASQIAFSYAWRAVESLPRRLLPPVALVFAISPLLDERSIRLITDLRTRGADLAVVEVSPLAHVPPGPTPTDLLAYRLWRLEREAIRARLRALGIAVALWDERHPLSPALEEVNAFHRLTRHAPAA
jgi:uncharacterized protein (DUF58 family)